jgi:hypothetical protein
LGRDEQVIALETIPLTGLKKPGANGAPSSLIAYSGLLAATRAGPPCIAPRREAFLAAFDQAALATVLAVGPLLGRAAHQPA